MVVFVMWLLLALIVGFVAQAKGRSGFGWFLLSVVISPIISLIILLVLSVGSGSSQVTVDPPSSTTRCDECREVIRRDAKRCKHCGAERVPEVFVQRAKPRVSQPVAMLIIAAGVIILITQCQPG